MGLHLFFLTNFPGAMFIQGAMFIPEPRVLMSKSDTFVVFTKVAAKGQLIS